MVVWGKSWGGSGLGEICCGSKFRVCVACRARRQATGERDMLLCVPKPCSRPLKTSVFTQVGSLGTISVRKKGVGVQKKKRAREESKDVPPFNNVTNILISKNKTSSSSFLLI